MSERLPHEARFVEVCIYIHRLDFVCSETALTILSVARVVRFVSLESEGR